MLFRSAKAGHVGGENRRQYFNLLRHSILNGMFILAQREGGGEAKTCVACGASFVCYARCADPERKCWCAHISVSAEALARLRQQYADCLCEACLRRAASD